MLSGKMVEENRDKLTTRPPKGESKHSAEMKRNMYQLFIKYRSMKIGKVFSDEDDVRKHKYTRQECYNLIQAKHYENKSTEIIKKYIKQFLKKNRL